MTEGGIGQQSGTIKCRDNGGGAEISGDGTIDDGKSANGIRGRRDCGQDTERPEGTFLEAQEEHVIWEIEPGYTSIKLQLRRQRSREIRARPPQPHRTFSRDENYYAGHSSIDLACYNFA